MKSDIYSLGLVFLNTTKVVLETEDFVRLKMNKNIIFNCLNPDFNEFNQIILPMLEKNPQNRPCL